ncbi:hypothetical protein Btru_074212 [Bulinus truncatus]|nr:hypothetical protein Btru_074212 [Bulinus truncatus]
MLELSDEWLKQALTSKVTACWRPSESEKDWLPNQSQVPHFIERYHCLMRGQEIKSSQIPWDICKLILQTQGSEYKNEYQIVEQQRSLHRKDVSSLKLIKIELKGGMQGCTNGC